MLDLYTLLLTLHILAVVAWLGTGLAMVTFSSRVTAANEAVLTEHYSWLGAKWFPIASGLAALTGIGLWIDGPWELGTAWIIIAVVGWIASAIIGATQLDPAVRKWHEGDQAAASRFRQLARVDLTVLTLVVADMVIKPFA